MNTHMGGNPRHYISIFSANSVQLDTVTLYEEKNIPNKNIKHIQYFHNTRIVLLKIGITMYIPII